MHHRKDGLLDRKDGLCDIERDIKDKFQWRWLEEKETNGDFLTYVRKLRLPMPGMPGLAQV